MVIVVECHLFMPDYRFLCVLPLSIGLATNRIVTPVAVMIRPNDSMNLPICGENICKNEILSISYMFVCVCARADFMALYTYFIQLDDLTLM